MLFLCLERWCMCAVGWCCCCRLTSSKASSLQQDLYLAQCDGKRLLRGPRTEHRDGGLKRCASSGFSIGQKREPSLTAAFLRRIMLRLLVPHRQPPNRTAAWITAPTGSKEELFLLFQMSHYTQVSQTPSMKKWTTAGPLSSSDKLPENNQVTERKLNILHPARVCSGNPTDLSPSLQMRLLLTRCSFHSIASTAWVSLQPASQGSCSFSNRLLPLLCFCIPKSNGRILPLGAFWKMKFNDVRISVTVITEFHFWSTKTPWFQ